MASSKKQNIEAIYPLSPMQQGMLFHTIYNPESEEYFEQLTATFSGKINTEAFINAINKVVENNSILRTSFAYKNVSKMLQIVHKKVEVPVDIMDWTSFSQNEVESRFGDLLNEDRKKGFNLSKAPLIRIKLIKINEEEYKFVWSHHHLLIDGWSLPILLKEVFTYYEMLNKGIQTQLPPKRPYQDYIKWLKTKNKDEAKNFWTSYLRGFTNPTKLHYDITNIEVGEYKKEKLSLPEELSVRIHKFVKEKKITLSSFLQSVWGILLSKYTSEEDVIFGATFSGRSPELPGSETMLGLFINTLPIRAKINPVAPITDWIVEFHKEQIPLKDFEWSALYEVQNYSELSNKQNLFDTLFVFENYPVDSTISKTNLSFEIKNVSTFERTNYPLTFVSSPAVPVTLEIAYDTSLFLNSTIKRMLNHFQIIIEQIVNNPKVSYKNLILLTDEDSRIINSILGVELEIDRSSNIIEEFKKIVETYPNHTAVASDGVEISYKELDEKSNIVASNLISRGVKLEDKIILYVDKSTNMIAAMFGILKAGAVFVSIDPVTPLERIHYIINDSQAKFVITNEVHMKNLEDLEIEKILLNEVTESPADQTTVNNEIKLHAENLAYIIYTSGSTGKPKGTLLQHLGVVNLAKSLSRFYEIEHDSNVLQFASINFDASIYEIFGGLLNGAKVTLYEKNNLKNPEDLLDEFEKLKVTFLTLPPTLLSVMKAKKINYLKTILSAGEACPTEVGLKWKKYYHFYNGYGPTEATVASTIERFDGTNKYLTIPIGNAIPNIKVYVLDKYLNKTPVGVTGELHISGVNLARGYLGKPALTAEKFIPDPFSGNSGARMYKTGDLVKIHEDGKLEFIGRIDNQIKLRGFRIELGEIESVLAEHPDISIAAVIVRESPNKEKILSAFIQLNNEDNFDKAKIFDYLKSKLPDYMVPTIITVLDEMPITINGKIDRRKLNELKIDVFEKGEYLAPESPTEILLAGIWGELTGVKKVGLNDNFFNLGGHSILATQAVSRIREAFGVEVSLKDFFEMKNLKELARLIDESDQSISQEIQKPIEKIERVGELPLSFSQQRLWFLSQFAPEGSSYNIPAVLELEGQLNLDALNYALNKMIERHEVLRTTFHSVNGKPQVRIEDNFEYKIELIDLSNDNRRDEKTKEILDETIRTPFDLTQIPLFSVKLIKTKPEAHICAIVMHHIISDGWSIGIIINEISELYKSFITSKEPLLDELIIQYVDYAAWQKNILSGETLEKEIEFWKNELEGASLILDLPTDKPRPQVQTFNGSNINFNLEERLSEKIEKVSAKLNITPYMFLLGAFEILLSKYSRQTDFVVGTPIANRTKLETEKLIGFFVNTLAIRATIDKNMTVQELMKSVRVKMLSAYSHQSLPFEKLVEVVQPERDTSHSPLFQVAFVFQNTPISAIELPELKVKQYEIESATANYDVTLYMQKNGKIFNGTFEYNTDLFYKETIRKIINEFSELIDKLTEDTKEKIRNISLVGNYELNKIVYEFNKSEHEFENSKCVHQKFEEWVYTNPNAIALTFTEVEEKLALTEQLTYEEVNKRANQLARLLRKNGVTRDTVVGISLPRSFEMAISMLAILKAGGAFLPIDPTYPEERIKHMIEDSGTDILISIEKISKNYKFYKGKIINLDSSKELINAEENTNLDNITYPENLAYIIYTSGSTGLPKGTMLSHKGLLNLSLAQKDAFGISGKSKILQFSSYSFDASVWEFVMALLNGASLSLVGQDIVKLGSSLKKVMEVLNITTVTLPPSVLKVIPFEEDKSNLAELETIIVAGESCPPELVNKWSKDRKFVNAYGPTETTVCASMHICNGEYSTVPPIGKPIYNFKLYILDDNLLPLPVGVPGELYIGGSGIARGYLNRPELTAEKFIPNPFAKINGERIYKSGDLARWLPNGEIEFLGRIDNQIKLRGFRIELGEIESVLRQDKAIKDVVVDIKKDSKNEDRLIGYVVPKVDEIDESELKLFARTKLPDYMVPQHFIKIESIPLSPSGKVDRKALPSPDFKNLRSSVKYVAPRNETEEILTGIIKDLLSVDKVGIHDNFFDLGGHSLLATQFVSQVQEKLGYDIPLRSLFENPTVEGLANLILNEEVKSVEENSSIEKLERGSASIEDLLNEINETK